MYSRFLPCTLRSGSLLPCSVSIRQLLSGSHYVRPSSLRLNRSLRAASYRYEVQTISQSFRTPGTSTRLCVLYSVRYPFDSRCSFLLRGLDQDCLREIFPEFTWLFKTHFCVRPLNLMDLQFRHCQAA